MQKHQPEDDTEVTVTTVYDTAQEDTLWYISAPTKRENPLIVVRIPQTLMYTVTSQVRDAPAELQRRFSRAKDACDAAADYLRRANISDQERRRRVHKRYDERDAKLKLKQNGDKPNG